MIERDAITIWHHLPEDVRAATMIDRATVDSATCNGILDILEQSGLEIAVWNATSDIGVATFHCLITDSADPQGHMGLGTGTHPDRGAALARALTEAVQTRMNYITGARDDLRSEEFTAEGRARKAREAKALLRMAAPLCVFTTIPSQVAETLREDVDWLIARLAGAGIDEIGCVDLSVGVPNLSVVRIVVPGLEAPHDDDAFVPGPRALAASRGGA